MLPQQYNYYGYWMTIAHIDGWSYQEINSLIIAVIHNQKLDWKDFFAQKTPQWNENLNLSAGQITSLEKAHKQLANISFYAEDLLSQGYKIIPLNAAEYSKTAKKNLGRRFSPPVLYAKGNLTLLNSPTITYVDNSSSVTTPPPLNHLLTGLTLVISPKNKSHIEILHQHLANNGQAILLLPCGIKRYTDSYKLYYKKIITGNLLIATPFWPDDQETPETIKLHKMIIRGMADRIELF